MAADRLILGTDDGTFYIHPPFELTHFGPHHHRFFEIAYFIHGSGTLHCNGQPCPLAPPQLHFCPPGEAWHSFEGQGGSILTSSMAIYPGLFPAPPNPLDPLSPLALLKRFCRFPTPMLSLQPSAARRAGELIELMCEEQRLQLPGHLLRITACVQELLVLALREQLGLHVHPSVAPRPPLPDTASHSQAALDRVPRITHAVATMKATLRSPLSNAELARQAGVQEKYFIRLFASEVGISPRRYYLRLRLEAAAQYLVNTDLSIAAIARTFGFSHRTYFQACFKRHFKIAPSLYRYANRRPA